MFSCVTHTQVSHWFHIIPLIYSSQYHVSNTLMWPQRLWWRGLVNMDVNTLQVLTNSLWKEEEKDTHNVSWWVTVNVNRLETFHSITGYSRFVTKIYIPPLNVYWFKWSVFSLLDNNQYLPWKKPYWWTPAEQPNWFNMGIARQQEAGSSAALCDPSVTWRRQ